MQLSIPDMSCGHCSAAVRRALEALDDGVQVTFDMAARRADVQTTARAEDILSALDEIGFPASMR
jgi:copper chaperone